MTRQRRQILASFYPSFLPSFLLSFLSILPSFFPSFLSFLPSFLPFFRPSFLPVFLPSFLPLGSNLFNLLLIHVAPNCFVCASRIRQQAESQLIKSLSLSSPSGQTQPSAVFSVIRHSTASSPATEATATSLLAYRIPIITRTTPSIAHHHRAVSVAIHAAIFTKFSSMSPVWVTALGFSYTQLLYTQLQHVSCPVDQGLRGQWCAPRGEASSDIFFWSAKTTLR